MKKVVLLGTNALAIDYHQLISLHPNMKIIAIIRSKKHEPFFEQPKTNHNYIEKEQVKAESFDFLFICDREILTEEEQIGLVNTATDIFTEGLLQKMQGFMQIFMQHMQNQELILNNMRDGLIVINDHADIQFMNQAARALVGVNHSDITNTPIKQIIKNSRLPNTLQSQKKEVNQQLILENKRKIITTRIPLINDHNHLIGAFAIFKDSNEVQKLAEENTDLKEIKTMLEAIIRSSEEAISVVDENGNGLMINPAYTRITGLSKNEVIGQPATVDISEGESMHYQVLKTRRPVRGAKMKVGPYKKEVIVNVAPVIVQGKLKGSVAVIHDISEINELTTALRKAKQMIRNLEATYTFDDIIGTSSEMMIAIEQAKIGAKTPATVLLRGNSGTGKELFAHAIHNESDRRYHKFIRVNCAALAESVLESELFGYVEGAFTGARVGGKKGLFEEANNGSIFLDEIGELSLHMQAKLLRVLQEKEIVRVGGTAPISLDVRIITATNTNLERAITVKEFREDLYYRLNRLPIYIPTLQERPHDLPVLVQHMIMKVNQLYGRNVNAIAPKALDKLYTYHWPGNIRELENVISRAMIFMDVTEEEIKYKHLPNLETKDVSPVVLSTPSAPKQTLQRATEQFEKEFIQRAYEENDCHKTKTAKQLHISVRTLYYKLEKYQIDT